MRISWINLGLLTLAALLSGFTISKFSMFAHILVCILASFVFPVFSIDKDK